MERRTTLVKEDGLSSAKIFGKEESCFDIEYEYEGPTVKRRVTLASGKVTESQVTAVEQSGDVFADFDLGWLATRQRPVGPRVSRSLGVVDLFCGCGGFSLGVWEAARSIGLRCRLVGAIDYDRQQAATFGKNFPDTELYVGDIGDYLSGAIGDPLSEAETVLQGSWAGVDFLIGGPPCQGHSNLNNATRRTDDRNLLSIRMARAAELFRPKFVVVENVPTIVNDKHRAAERLRDHLDTDLGYESIQVKLRAEDFGVAQTRHRAFIIAWDKDSFPLSKTSVEEAINKQRVKSQRSVEWCWRAMDTDPNTLFDTPSTPNDDTQKRLRYFAENEGEINLPDEFRPDCHRTKTHTYESVYGRMRPGRPAPTLTTGFSAMGRGRFVHPHEARLITPHEASRIQFFPEFFEFECENRSEYTRAIGNAVPPKLGFVIAIALLGLTS